MTNAKVTITSKLPSIATLIWLAHNLPNIKVNNHKKKNDK